MAVALFVLAALGLGLGLALGRGAPQTSCGAAARRPEDRCAECPLRQGRDPR